MFTRRLVSAPWTQCHPCNTVSAGLLFSSGIHYILIWSICFSLYMWCLCIMLLFKAIQKALKDLISPGSNRNAPHCSTSIHRYNVECILPGRISPGPIFTQHKQISHLLFMEMWIPNECISSINPCSRVLKHIHKAMSSHSRFHTFTHKCSFHCSLIWTQERMLITQISYGWPDTSAEEASSWIVITGKKTNILLVSSISQSVQFLLSVKEYRFVSQ